VNVNGERCGSSIVIVGYTWQCNLPSGHEGRHHAKVDWETHLEDDYVFEAGTEIVWPGGTDAAAQ